jgi:hypothetical protein
VHSIDFDSTYESLFGFLLAHNRLPCPDVTNDGNEDCAAVSGALPQIGRLPFVTLRYVQPTYNGSKQFIGYGVYRMQMLLPERTAT